MINLSVSLIKFVSKFVHDIFLSLSTKFETLLIPLFFVNALAT